MTREQELEATLRKLIATVPPELLGQIRTFDPGNLAVGTKEYPAFRIAVAEAKKILGLHLLDA